MLTGDEPEVKHPDGSKQIGPNLQTPLLHSVNLVCTWHVTGTVSLLATGSTRFSGARSSLIFKIKVRFSSSSCLFHWRHWSCVSPPAVPAWTYKNTMFGILQCLKRHSVVLGKTKMQFIYFLYTFLKLTDEHNVYITPVGAVIMCICPLWSHM